MEYSRQEYLSGLPFPSPRNLPNLGIEPGSLALQADSLPFKPPEKLPYKGVHRAGLLQICCWPTPVLECSGNCLREQVSHPSHGASDSLGLRLVLWFYISNTCGMMLKLHFADNTSLSLSLSLFFLLKYS